MATNQSAYDTLRTAVKKRQRRQYHERHKDEAKAYQRRYKYNMSERDYGLRVSLQGNACVICRRADRVLCVDHDHGCCSDAFSCGRCVRSLLCRPCNAGLGAFDDSPERLERAVAYLAYWRRRHGR